MQQKPALGCSFLFDLEYSNLQFTLTKQVNCCYPVSILSTVWYFRDLLLECFVPSGDVTTTIYLLLLLSTDSQESRRNRGQLDLFGKLVKRLTPLACLSCQFSFPFLPPSPSCFWPNFFLFPCLFVNCSTIFFADQILLSRQFRGRGSPERALHLADLDPHLLRCALHTWLVSPGSLAGRNRCSGEPLRFSWSGRWCDVLLLTQVFIRRVTA